MDFWIRDAISADAEGIAQLVRQLAAAFGQRSPVSASFVLHYLAQDRSAVLLAEDDDHQLLGLVSYTLRPNLYHAGNTCLIEELIVRDQVRGQGVGSALVTTLLERLKSTDCVEVSVSTLMDNQPAIRFYRDHGFVDEALLLEQHLCRVETGVAD